jgi:hypothetical protein
MNETVRPELARPEPSLRYRWLVLNLRQPGRVWQPLLLRRAEPAGSAALDPAAAAGNGAAWAWAGDDHYGYAQGSYIASREKPLPQRSQSSRGRANGYGFSEVATVLAGWGLKSRAARDVQGYEGKGFPVGIAISGG